MSSVGEEEVGDHMSLVGTFRPLATGGLLAAAVTALAPLALADAPMSGANSVNSVPVGASSVHAADVDGDGDIDVLGAAYLADGITWWENDSAVMAAFYAPCLTNTLDASMNLTCFLTNSMVAVMGTQWVCVGWIRTGSQPDIGEGSKTTASGRPLNAAKALSRSSGLCTSRT